MSLTILVPDWDAIDREMRSLGASRRGFKGNLKMLGYTLEFDQAFGCDVIVIKSRLEEIPPPLADVPLKVISRAQPHSAFLGVPAGHYMEDVELEPSWELKYQCYADVETYYRNGVLQQSFKATSNDAELRDLNDWFDALLTGEKNRWCDHPAELPEQPLSLQVLDALEQARKIVKSRLDHGIVATKGEEFLEDFERLFAILHGHERFEKPKPAGVDLDLDWAIQLIDDLFARRSANLGKELRGRLNILQYQLMEARGDYN